MPEPEVSDPFKNNVPGSTFSRERGKLYRFSSRGVVVIRPWPEPQGWAKRNGGMWTACRPKVDLSASSDAHTPASWISIAEMECFQALVPQDVIQAVLGARLFDHQWEALQLAARVPGAMQMMRDVPLLAAALSCSRKLKLKPVARPLRSARTLLRHRPGMRTWRRVAAWLDFGGGSKSMVKTLRRMALNDEWPWTLDQLHRLRSLWAVPAARKRILHADRLDRNVLDVTFFARSCGVLDRVHPDLLDGAYNAGGPSITASCMRETAESWPVMRPRRPFPMLRSVENLEALREELRTEIEAKYLQTAVMPTPTDFPPPPLPPAPSIRPLGSSEALVAEAKEMGNCLDEAYWARDARLRRGYAYRVEAAQDEVADIWVEPLRTPGTRGLFKAVEVRGPKNAPPSDACLQAVQGWIGEHHRRVLGSPSPLQQIPAPWRRAWTELPVAALEHPRQVSWALDVIPF